MNTEDAKERAQDLLRETDNCIRANPVPAVLTALGIGIAWVLSLLRVVRMMILLGGLAALIAYIQKKQGPTQ